MKVAINPADFSLDAALELSAGNVQLKALNNLVFLHQFNGESVYLSDFTMKSNYPNSAYGPCIIQCMTASAYPFIGTDDYYCGEPTLAPTLVPTVPSISNSSVMSIGFALNLLLDPGDVGPQLHCMLTNQNYFFYLQDGGVHYYGASVLDSNKDENLIYFEDIELETTKWYWNNLYITENHIYLTRKKQETGVETSVDAEFLGMYIDTVGPGWFSIHQLDTIGMCIAEIIIRHNSNAIALPTEHFKIYPESAQKAVVTLGDGKARRWDKSSLGFINEAPFDSEYIKLRATISASATPSFTGDPETLDAFRADDDEDGGYLHFEFPITSPDGDTQIELTPGWIDYSDSSSGNEDTNIITNVKFKSVRVT